MKHSHRVHSSKRNLSLRAKSYPVERKERNTEGQNGLAVWTGEMPRYWDRGARVGVTRKVGTSVPSEGKFSLDSGLQPHRLRLF